MMPETTRRPTTAGNSIAVTGSKGGVGKSNLAVNLAVALAAEDRRVLVVDGDLALANLDVLLGLVPLCNIEHLLRGDVRLEQLLVEGPRGIRILPASCGVPQLARLDPEARRRLLTVLDETTTMADHVLVDTGAGLGETTLSLQLAASRVLVVTTPEPTSLVDAYASIKVLWDADPERRIDLVVNNVATDEEARAAHGQIARACRHFLGREPGCLGPVYHDPELPGAVKRQRALLEINPISRAARCYERIALQLRVDSAPSAASGFWNRLAEEPERETCH